MRHPSGNKICSLWGKSKTAYIPFCKLVMLFLGVGLKHNCREHPKLFANLTIHAMVLSKHANNFFSTEDRRGRKYLELGHSTTKRKGEE